MFELTKKLTKKYPKSKEKQENIFGLHLLLKLC